MTIGAIDPNSRTERTNPRVALGALYDSFTQRTGARFIFIEPGGNFGDRLIYLGAKKLARMAGLSFWTISHDYFMRTKFYPDDILYIHGGGGFNPWWSGRPIRALHRALATHKGCVIVGPQSYWLDREFLVRQIVEPLASRISEEVILFARERATFEYLQDILPKDIPLKLDHDTAVYLERKDLLTDNSHRRYRLAVIRTDTEYANYPSFGNDWIRLDPVAYCKSFEHWLKVHDSASEIVTNRLHSAIAGAILGVPTAVLPNSYHKNRAMWEHSLRNLDVLWKEPHGNHTGSPNLMKKQLAKYVMDPLRYRQYRRKQI